MRAFYCSTFILGLAVTACAALIATSALSDRQRSIAVLAITGCVAALLCIVVYRLERSMHANRVCPISASASLSGEECDGGSARRASLTHHNLRVASFKRQSVAGNEETLVERFTPASPLHSPRPSSATKYEFRPGVTVRDIGVMTKDRYPYLQQTTPQKNDGVATTDSLGSINSRSNSLRSTSSAVIVTSSLRSDISRVQATPAGVVHINSPSNHHHVNNTPTNLASTESAPEVCFVAGDKMWRRSDTVLGKGSFGEVYLGMCMSDAARGVPVAIKTMKITRTRQHPAVNGTAPTPRAVLAQQRRDRNSPAALDRQMQQYVSEVQHLCGIEHDSIVTFYSS
eukprot:PhM_4_TR18656/c0_g2_i3/m.75812